MVQQKQFLNVVDRDEAARRFEAALRLDPLGAELVDVSAALGRTLATDSIAQINVPAFDRSNFDGFAVCAADTFGASEREPRRLRLLDERIPTAAIPQCTIAHGTAAGIATGAMIPRGADAVVLIEHTNLVRERSEGNDPASGPSEQSFILVNRSVSPGFGISFTGTDVAVGQTVLRSGDLLTSRETGVLSAIGETQVAVWRLPRVAIISTGDEIIPPGEPMRPGMVYDSNARILADAVRELGCEPVELGIAIDNVSDLRALVQQGLFQCDAVLLSGGTSKGDGDLSYVVVSEFKDPGIVVHGVALKPGKPICLAVTKNKPLVVLPGFPTSAIFTFHEFVAPVIRRLAGRSPTSAANVQARLAMKVNSEIGRTEYLLVGLIEKTLADSHSLVAYPIGKGSGSVTTFSQADGFIKIDRHTEILQAGSVVEVQLIASELQVADLTVIGSHCLGLDWLLSEMQRQGIRTKFFAAGSSAGLQAAERGDCDLAGIHLFDEKTGRYNAPFLSERVQLVRGYARMQGLVFRRDDERFQGADFREIIARVSNDPSCLMINRNQGSGTRLLIDRLLGGKQPAGYAVQASNHHAATAAVSQKRADWTVAIASAVRDEQLVFLPIEQEQYDFAVPRSRMNRAAVRKFCDLLALPAIVERLREVVEN